MDEIMFVVKNIVHIQELWMKLDKGQSMIGVPKRGLFHFTFSKTSHVNMLLKLNDTFKV